MQKRVLTIQDFSALGRCSLTVALPTISAAGLECVALPTAVLSNHTAFPSFTLTDLSDTLLPSVQKWEGFKDHFDYIYTGYLLTEQIPLVIEIIKRFKREGTIVLIDPAMADHGALYPGFEAKHIEAMKTLLSYADILVPNLTEACLLSGYAMLSEEQEPSSSSVKEILSLLSSLGPKNIVLTGIESKGKEVMDIVSEGGRILSYSTPLYPSRFHGTGDLFASSLIGALGNDFPLFESVKIAHDFVHESIRFTNEEGDDGLLYGPHFEEAIPFYLKELQRL